MNKNSGEEKTAKYFSMARDLTTAFNNCLPKSISATTLTPNSKLPFKALSLREVLLCRVAELSVTAMDLFDRQKTVSAFIVTRSVVETVSLAFWLHKKIINYMKSKDIEAFDDFLMKALIGGRVKAAPLESYNILSAVDHMDKVYKGYRELYNDLSEVAHPNWPGVLGAYGKVADEGLSLLLCKCIRLTNPIFTSPSSHDSMFFRKKEGICQKTIVSTTPIRSANSGKTMLSSGSKEV